MPRPFSDPRGVGPLVPDRADRLAALLANDIRSVVVDCGTAPAGVAADLAERSDQSILVTRPCYLALRRVLSVSLPRPNGVIVVREPRRVLEAQDVAAAVGAPILAEIAYDPPVARAVDAGLPAGRLPRSLDASLATAPVAGAGARTERLARPGHTGVANAAGLDESGVSAW